MTLEQRVQNSLGSLMLTILSLEQANEETQAKLIELQKQIDELPKSE